MNNIEITEEQKVKLLKMSNTLFKGTIINGYSIDRIVMSNQQGSCGMHSRQENQVFVYIAEQMGFPIDIIHWFEFCMTHLVEKILNPKPNNPNRGLQERFKEFFWETNLYAMKCNKESLHPIDYLYNEFKKLK